MPSRRKVNTWIGECLRKKKLSEESAHGVIKKAMKEDGTILFKYFCPHCQHWHLTKKLKTHL